MPRRNHAATRHQPRPPETPTPRRPMSYEKMAQALVDKGLATIGNLDRPRGQQPMNNRREW